MEKTTQLKGFCQVTCVFLSRECEKLLPQLKAKVGLQKTIAKAAIFCDQKSSASALKELLKTNKDQQFRLMVARFLSRHGDDQGREDDARLSQEGEMGRTDSWRRFFSHSLAIRAARIS